MAEDDAPVLVDAVGELRIAAVAADQGWDSVFRVAYGWGQPDPTLDPTDPVTGPGALRWVLGLGTGW